MNPDNDLFVEPEEYEKLQVLEYNIVEPNGYIVQYGLMEVAYQITNTFTKDKTLVGQITIDTCYLPQSNARYA